MGPLVRLSCWPLEPQAGTSIYLPPRTKWTLIRIQAPGWVDGRDSVVEGLELTSPVPELASAGVNPGSPVVEGQELTSPVPAFAPPGVDPRRRRQSGFWQRNVGTGGVLAATRGD